MMEERWFTDERMLAHTSPKGYPEMPERLAAVLAAAKARAAPVVPLSEDDTDVEEWASAVHDAAYVARFRTAVARGDGLLDSADNPLSGGTWVAACAAARVAVRAAEWMAAGRSRHAFAAVRPPGHHAERDRAMGFCYLSNVAIAAQQLRDSSGMERVAVVDFDVHHGNGTQHIFESCRDVLFVSLHQFPFYPGTGAAEERGLGVGEGATVNVPLAAGTGDQGYAKAFEEIVLPSLESFRPQALLVSAGFDAWRGDPLGGMQVSEAGFHQWGRSLAAAADRLCEGRMLSALEGGYDVPSLGRVVGAYLDGVAGVAL